jgi:hypothetical protein
VGVPLRGASLGRERSTDGRGTLLALVRGCQAQRPARTSEKAVGAKYAPDDDPHDGSPRAGRSGRTWVRLPTHSGGDPHLAVRSMGMVEDNATYAVGGCTQDAYSIGAGRCELRRTPSTRSSGACHGRLQPLWSCTLRSPPSAIRARNRSPGGWVFWDSHLRLNATASLCGTGRCGA